MTEPGMRRSATPGQHTTMGIRTLTYKELSEIDQLSFKANSILTEARQRLASYDWDLAVRGAQEAVELYTKTLFRFIGREYPPSHDLSKGEGIGKNTIYEMSALLEGYGVERPEVARLVLANSTLGAWRSSAFYGDERLGVAKVFRQKEAEVAVGLAQEVMFTCEKVRGVLYRRAKNPSS